MENLVTKVYFFLSKIKNLHKEAFEYYIIKLILLKKLS